MMKPGKRKHTAAAPRKERTWFPKQITKAEYKKRHAVHCKRQRRMGVPDAEMGMLESGKFSKRI